MMKLVEECAGQGEILRNGQTLHSVHYQVRRFQGLMEGSGLPIPGLFRIEGSIDINSGTNTDAWLNVPLTLRLEDGRSLGINVVDTTGRILCEGHGPLKCMCC